MEGIIFIDKEHEKAFYKYMEEFHIPKGWDELVALIYLLTITADCRHYILDCYDPKERCIKPAALKHSWVTGTDRRVIRLAFNLFTGNVTILNSENDESDEQYSENDRIGGLADLDLEGHDIIDDYRETTPIELFRYTDISLCMFQGIMIRFHLNDFGRILMRPTLS